MSVNGVQERIITPDPVTLGTPPSGKYWDGYDATGYWIKLDTGVVVRPDIGTGINWSEDYTAFGPGSSGAWTSVNLGVGFEDALVEIMIISASNNRTVGVREVGSGNNRTARIDLDSSLTMSVRADGSGNVELFSNNIGGVTYLIIARWQ